ncbi:hypothetical protein [Pseudomonas sp. Irchel s3h9]|uniref:hypothetical protein n=1 Tax=Pseudomonas sp. Irchel s3h9 TaxID=2009192 RepID=UPI00114080F1|nr:hypothetical protein [Pseudomonas sp. Irchel s3h9]
MYYILDSKGGFLYSDASNKNYSDWTLIPLPQPCWNPRFTGARDKETGEWTGMWVQDGEPVPTADEICLRIDTYADEIRRLVAGDPLRAVEYERATAEAQQFKDDGYPGDAVPRTVAAWAITGRTPREAADSMLAEASQYVQVLNFIRENRLQAKEQIKQKIATGATIEAKQIADEAIIAIQAAAADVRPAIG